LVDLAHAQDVEAGDGTTTVTVVAGALLGAVQQLLSRGIHPTVISEAFFESSFKSRRNFGRNGNTCGIGR
jgi:T-complex protein 1 subunit delta